MIVENIENKNNVNLFSVVSCMKFYDFFRFVELNITVNCMHTVYVGILENFLASHVSKNYVYKYVVFQQSTALNQFHIDERYLLVLTSPGQRIL